MTTFDKKDSQALKGLAILMMLFHHCFYTKDRFAQYNVNFFPFSMEGAMDLAAFCKICVALFVFISGYGIAVSMSKCKTHLESRKKTTSRFISLMMNFWIVYILSVIATAIIRPELFKVYDNTKPGLDTYLPAIVTNVVLDFFGVSELCGTPTLNATWWYMSLALIIIAVTPILVEINKRYGSLALIITGFFLRYVYMRLNFDMTRYIPILIMGIIFADNNLLGKLKTNNWAKVGALDYMLKLAVFTPLLWLAYYIRIRNRVSGVFAEVCECLVPLITIIFFVVIVFKIKPIRIILGFLGKYSTNIFLTHTFIRYYFFQDFTYSFGNAYLIFLVLLGTSLALGIAVSLLQKLCGVDKAAAEFSNWLGNRLDARNIKPENKIEASSAEAPQQ